VVKLFGHPREVAVEPDFERPRHQAVVEPDFERPREVAAAPDFERSKRRAVVVPNRRERRLRVDSMLLVHRPAVPGAANPTLLCRQVLLPSFSRYCGKEKGLLPG